MITVQKNKMRISAEVFHAESSLGAYVTDGEDRLIIGSSKQADLVVPHDKISQVHAMLKIQDDTHILLCDLGSAAGTFVKGKKIIQKKLLPGDFFEIGNHKIRVDMLLGKDGSMTDERALFWKNAPTSHNYLEVLSLSNSTVVDEKSVGLNAKLHFGGKRNQIQIPGIQSTGIFLVRTDKSTQSSVEGLVPAGFAAEIYDNRNQLVRKIEQADSKFTFGGTEKARLIPLAASQQVELQIFWRETGERAQRKIRDDESIHLKKALIGSLLLVSLIGSISALRPAKKEIIEEATLPKSSYLRVTMGSEAPPLGEPDAQPGQSSESKAENKPQQVAPSKVANIQNSLSKLLSKKSSVDAESFSQAISNDGKQTTRLAAISNANLKTGAIATGGGGGAVNVAAMSAGLSTGSGTGTGNMKGFANGKIGGLGAGQGASGKGFNMSLGGEEAEAIGGLDKSLIAAVVQANIGQIKHCYERQLILDPNIFGKVVAQWTIDKDGNVNSSSLKKTTMNSQPVENCILAKIKSWQFPKPKGGGQVLVSYPFLFKSLN